MWEELLSNKALIAAVYAWFIAQLIKVLLTALFDKKIDLTRMYGAGGMPSSHSALVCAMTAYLGKTHGLGDPIFAISCAFSMVVMYDAAGVRLAAGKQARAINLLFKHTNLNTEETLKDLLGHTPLQVVCGAILGIIVGIIYF